MFWFGWQRRGVTGGREYTLQSSWLKQLQLLGKGRWAAADVRVGITR